MKYIFIFFTTFCFSQSIDDFRGDLSRIEKEHLENNFEGNIAFINQLLDQHKYPDSQSVYVLESYKVAALVQAQEYEVAIDLSEKLLKQKNNPPEMVLKLRIQRSLVYEILLLLDQSTWELQQAEVLLEKHPAFRNKYYSTFLVRSASLNRIKKDHELSLQLADKAIHFSERIGDYQHIAEATMLKAFYHREKNADSFVLNDLYRKSLQSAKKVNNQGLIIAIYLNLSSQSLKLKDSKNAMIYADSADVLINKNGDYLSQYRVYKNKSDIFESENKYDSALVYFKKYEIAHSLLDEAGQKIKITELDRRNLMQAELNEKRSIKTTLENTKKFNNRLLILISSLAVVLTILIFAIYHLNKRGEKIFNQREKIKVKNDELNQLVKQQLFLVQELNHRVKNNLSAILSLVQLQSEEADLEEYKNNFKKLHERIHTISEGHHLYTYSHNHTDSALIDVRIYTDKILNNKKNALPYFVEITNDCDDILLTIDTTLPIGLILNELISNSEKHAQLSDNENLKINLSLKKKENQVEMTYEDNGTYFNDNKSAEALGMYIITGMIEQLRGTFRREKSKYIIYFPA